MTTMRQNKNKGSSSLIAKLIKRKLLIVTGAIAAALIVLGLGLWIWNTSSFDVTQDDRIDITPTQIRSIEAIGQWQFLTISDEEMVDTVRHGFFGDDQLVRIYYGTIRLGIDLQDTRPGWIRSDGDSIKVMLPPVKILDNDFIDEARTRSFSESGHWTEADREALYQRAETKMKARCLSEENLRSARENGSRQFYRLLRSMGYENIIIRYQQ